MIMNIPKDFSITIDDDEYKDIVEFIYKWSGINLGEHKKELVKARLSKRIRYYGFSTVKQYYEYVTNGANRDELTELFNAISTNVTSFFREAKHFEILTNKVLPELIELKQKKRDRKIRIWSAACSTGEEVYTILITLLEYLKETLTWDIKILGTDISTKVLAQAKAGTYEAEKVKDVSPLILNKYFDMQIENGKTYYQVRNIFKDFVIFGRLNLMDEAFPFSSKPDIIFCRNVMIYFDKSTQARLIKKIHNCLSPQGYLFMGHSESLMGIDVVFENVAPAVYKKI